MTGAPDPAAQPGETWYVPAVRNNVIGMMSASLVMPAVGLTKYYDDVLSLVPGRILLTTTGARGDWFGTADDGSDLPSLVELALRLSGTEKLEGADGTVAAPAAVVPRSRVRRIHFRSARDAEEFQARRYDNFSPDDTVVLVSPELFERDLPSPEEIASWVSSRGDEDPPLDAADITSADCFTGALTMLVGCPATSGAELEVRATLFGRLAAAAHDAPPAAAVAEALGTDDWLSGDSDDDRALLRAVTQVLGSIAPASRLGARRVLTDVRRALGDGAERPAVAANLARAESILKSESELRPMGSSGLRSAKALLLFLLRPRPEEVVTWADDMAGDPFAVTGAAVLSGLTCGARLVPEDIRPSGAMGLLTEIEADRINGSRGFPLGPFAPSVSKAVHLDTEPGEHGERRILAIGEHQMSARLTPPVEPGQGELFADEPAPAQVDGHDLIALVEGADLARPEIARAAAAVCRRYGWDDLVQTVVPYGAEGFRAALSEVTFPGIPDIRRLVDSAGLLDRLKAVESLDNSPEVAVLVEALTQKAGTKRRTAPPRLPRT